MIYVGFSTNNAIGSRLIRWATRAPCSHCYIKAGGWLFHARFKQGVFWERAESFYSNNEILEEIAIDVDLDQLYDFTSRYVGKSYSWMNVIGFVWVLFWEFFGVKVSKNPLGDTDDALFCSELVALFLSEAGVAQIKPNKAEVLHPEDVCQVLHEVV